MIVQSTAASAKIGAHDTSADFAAIVEKRVGGLSKVMQ